MSLKFLVGLQKIFLTRWAAFIHDVLCVPLSLYCAYWLRFNLTAIPPEFFRGGLVLLAVVLPIQAGLFWLFGFYRGLWRFASLPDIVRIIRAVFFGSLLSSILSLVIFDLPFIPRSVFVLYPCLLGIFLSGSRFLYRYSLDRHLYFGPCHGKPVVIFGAGRAGASLAQEILASSTYQLVGFLDDDPKKHGREIRGIRVLGDLSRLEYLSSRGVVAEVFIAIPKAAQSVVQRIVDESAQCALRCKTLPDLVTLGGRQIEIGHLRSVTVADLLGRDPVDLDREAIARYVQGQNILVTGGGGSIGSELCRQIAGADPQRLIIYENSEFNLYSIEQELRKAYPDLDLKAVLGDVKVMNRVDWTFRTFRPTVVFHAAAFKHVPMVEKNPAEGVFNNVFGTKIVADTSDAYGVKRFVLVSTDKAVNPANVMGATKRIAELYCQNLAARSQTKFITTRFGNVLGSAGSVVPLFEQQIRDGGPVTVTHRKISRYFMTISEAVGLILQAGSMGEGGEIYVLEMGEPILIDDLAKQMIRMSGHTPGQNIEISYIGLRPGEKLYEEIFHANEGLMGTGHPKLLLAKSREVSWQWLSDELIILRKTAEKRDINQLLQCLHTLVPEFQDGSTSKKLNHEKGFVQKRLKVVQGAG